MLSPEVARLVDPVPAPFAAALAALLDDPAAGRALATAAKVLSDARYSREVYLTRTAEACRRLAAVRDGAPAARPATETVAR